MFAIQRDQPSHRAGPLHTRRYPEPRLKNLHSPYTQARAPLSPAPAGAGLFLPVHREGPYRAAETAHRRRIPAGVPVRGSCSPYPAGPARSFPIPNRCVGHGSRVPVPSGPLGGWGGLVDLYFVLLSFVCLYFVILYLVVCGFPFAVNPFAENPFAENPFAVNPSAVFRHGEVKSHNRPDPPVCFPFQTGASVTAVGSRSHPAPWGVGGDWLIFTLFFFLWFIFLLFIFI